MAFKLIRFYFVSFSLFLPPWLCAIRNGFRFDVVTAYFYYICLIWHFHRSNASQQTPSKWQTKTEAINDVTKWIFYFHSVRSLTTFIMFNALSLMALFGFESVRTKEHTHKKMKTHKNLVAVSFDINWEKCGARLPLYLFLRAGIYTFFRLFNTLFFL